MRETLLIGGKGHGRRLKFHVRSDILLFPIMGGGVQKYRRIKVVGFDPSPRSITEPVSPFPGLRTGIRSVFVPETMTPREATDALTSFLFCEWVFDEPEITGRFMPNLEWQEDA